MGFCYFAISHHICNCYPFRERRVFLFFPKENHHEQNRRCGNCCKRQQFRPTSTIRTHKPRIYHLWPYGHPRPRKWQKRHCPHRQGNCGTNFRIDRRPWSHPQRPSQKHANEGVGFAHNVYALAENSRIANRRGELCSSVNKSTSQKNFHTRGD